MSERPGQRPIDDALIDAIWAKDPVAVRAALAASALVEARDPEHWETALTVAAHAGNAGEIIPILLAAGADLNAHDQQFGNTPLMWTCGKRQLEALKLLVAAGCDVNASNVNDETALHKCAASGNLAGAKVLIAAGADVDADLDGEGTPLFEAILQGHPALVSLLASAGADLSYRHGGFGPVLVAASTHSSSNVEVVAALLRAGAEVDATDGRGRTALHEAVTAGRGATESITSYALSGHTSRPGERSCLTARRFIAEQFPSAYAPRAGIRGLHNEEVVTEGTLIALRDMLSKGTLRYANDAGLWKIVTDLQLAESRRRPAQSKTDAPLHAPASEEEIREVEELITYHHSLDIRARSLSVIRQLLDAGACPLVQDKDGNSPLDLATFGGFDEAVALLADAAGNRKV